VVGLPPSAPPRAANKAKPPVLFNTRRFDRLSFSSVDAPASRVLRQARPAASGASHRMGARSSIASVAATESLVRSALAGGVAGASMPTDTPAFERQQLSQITFERALATQLAPVISEMASDAGVRNAVMNLSSVNALLYLQDESDLVQGSAHIERCFDSARNAAVLVGDASQQQQQQHHQEELEHQQQEQSQHQQRGVTPAEKARLTLIYEVALPVAIAVIAVQMLPTKALAAAEKFIASMWRVAVDRLFASGTIVA
jgi:hypothetical protein